jgi:hypothetical protein
MRILILVTSLFFFVVQIAHASPSISEKEILAAEKAWGNAIVEIGKAYMTGKNYKVLAAQYIDDLYAYDETTVLFKPTKASAVPFRLSESEAVSYFVTGVIPEDHGFALQPWSKVRFENSGIIIDKNTATAMGHYYFTDAKSGKEVVAEYTLEFMKNKEEKLLITVHHSSFPYKH